MKIVCPPCNTGYKIPGKRIPQRIRAAATCRKCCGKITIEPGAGQELDYSAQAEPISRPPVSSNHKRPSSTAMGTGEFEFIIKSGEFKGYAGL